MIAHYDLDAFYAAVAQRDDPRLRGKPVAIAGSSRRAVVLTASYEARRYGVRSAIPLAAAREACPHLIVVTPDFAAYRRASQAAFAIFALDAVAIEGLSLDEAFVTYQDREPKAVIAQARRVRARVRDEVGLTVSAGIAAGKMVAKIASDAAKPDGLAIVAPGAEAEYLAPLPVGRLWGVGPKTQARLHAVGIETIGDVARLDDARLSALFGRHGRDLRDLAAGIDRRTVSGQRRRLSISTEETFERDLTLEEPLLAVLRRQAEELAADLRRRGMRAATIGVKVKRADFTVIGRQVRTQPATDDPTTIAAAAIACWRRAALIGVPIRLIGIRCGDLITEERRELSLFG